MDDAMEIVVVEFEGGIGDFPQLVQTVDNLIADGARRIVLDLNSLPFINSAALGYLIRAMKGIGAQGGELTLARVQAAIQKILEITNLDQFFPSFQTVEEAVSYLGGDPSAPQTPSKPKVRRTAVKKAT
jgi:anti-sigma B factor antagonist